MSVLIPLYIYPWPGAWDALYWEANKNPTLNFTVILNPCSGPCMNTIPALEYLAEMPRIKQWPNIKTLGYVATNYTTKDYDEVVAEIQRYAQWPTLYNDSRLAVDGIFFDETPGLYQWQSHDYLAGAAAEVRNHPDLGAQQVVHNPGTIPDPTWNYLDIADTTVVFEDAFASFIDGTRFSRLQDLHVVTNRPLSAFAIMLHSLGSIPDELIEWAGEQMRTMAGSSYATDVSATGDWWHSWPTILDAFVTNYAAAAAEASGDGGNCSIRR